MKNKKEQKLFLFTALLVLATLVLLLMVVNAFLVWQLF